MARGNSAKSRDARVPAPSLRAQFPVRYRKEDFMTDNVESHTLALLREMRSEIASFRGEFVSFREETANNFSEVKADVAELQVAVAALSADLKIVKKDVEDVKETSSIIEGRLVRIEKQLGFVKA
jgi:hypothetical protein